jgi:hypothetical protein
MVHPRRIANMNRRELLKGLLSTTALAGIAGATGAEAQDRVPAGAKSYFGRFSDADCYLLALAADLQTYRRLAGLRPSKTLQEMNRLAVQVYKKGGVTTREGGWLFEPGIYEDHPDTAYAGNTVKALDMKLAKIKGIALDSSHFMRWPLFLWSEEEASTSSKDRDYYARLREELTKQFLTKVLVRPSAEFRGYRINNYMDGNNGVYRWKYSTTPDNGYGPYELSSSLLCGWWTFLRDPKVREAYRELSKEFPFAPAEIAVYNGPNKNPVSFTRGTFELLCRLAGKMNFSGKAPAPADVVDEKDDKLWNASEKYRLDQPIWRGINAEYAQITLMVPLHAAFLNSQPEWQKQFASHFARFAEKGPSDMDAGLLARFEYLFFATRFAVLARQTGHDDLVPEKLPTAIEDQVAKWWSGDNGSISNTGYGEKKFKSYDDYLQWKVDLDRG